MTDNHQSTYHNGSGSVPRLPCRVVDTLIDSAGVSRLTYNNTDQTGQVEQLVHDACEELLARLTPSPDVLGKVKSLGLTPPKRWEENVTDASAVGEARALAKEVQAWRDLFATLAPVLDGAFNGESDDERTVQASVCVDESTKHADASSGKNARADQSPEHKVEQAAQPAGGRIISDLAPAFQEYLYRVSSQAPFEIAQWAHERGAALLAELKKRDSLRLMWSCPILFHRPIGTPGWYEADAAYTQQLMNSSSSSRFEFRTLYGTPVAAREPEPFAWFHTTSNADGSTFTSSTREDDPNAFPLYKLAGTRSAEENADAFCDANCVWTNHHPACAYGMPGRDHAGTVLTTEQLLRIIGESTGRRINLGLDDLDQYLSVARASIAAAFAVRISG